MNSISYKNIQSDEDIEFWKKLEKLRFLEWGFFNVLMNLKENQKNNNIFYKEVFSIIQESRTYRDTLKRTWNRENIDFIIEVFSQELDYIVTSVENIDKFEGNLLDFTFISNFVKRISWYRKMFNESEKEIEDKKRRVKLLDYFQTSTDWEFRTLKEQDWVRKRVDSLVSVITNDENYSNYKEDLLAMKKEPLPTFIKDKNISLSHIQWIRNILNDPNTTREEKAKLSLDLRKTFGSSAANDAIYLSQNEFIDVYSPEFDFFRISKITTYKSVKNNTRMEVYFRKKWDLKAKKWVLFTDLSEFVRWTKIKFYDFNWNYYDKLSLIDHKKWTNDNQNITILNWNIIPQTKNNVEEKKQEKKWFFSNVKDKVKWFFGKFF